MENIPVMITGGIIDILIPVLIFMFLNKKIFFSDYNNKDEGGKSKLRKVKNFLGLMLLSPIGLFIVLFMVIMFVETILKAYFTASGLMDYSLDSLMNPSLSLEDGLTIDPQASGTNEALLTTLVLTFLLAVPVVVLFIRKYSKVVGCSTGMGVFIYMAVLYMLVISTIVSFPLRTRHPSLSSIASTFTFIAALLIFYLPSVGNIELMRRETDTKLLLQTNTLPIINFILLVMLLALEFMLDINKYLDLPYYLMILAFSVLLYSSAQLSYGILFRHIDEKMQIETLSKEAIEAEEEIILAFAEITEAKSGQTGKHVKRVSEYSRVLAKAMGMTPKQVEEIRLASMMHDIGKLLIPPEVLEKKGKLTDEEFKIIKKHVTIGESLLHSAPGEIMRIARLIALEHHEWWNGKGYLGMSYQEIALSARITAVADVYDALTSKRSYKKEWTDEEAYNIIMEESGSHFDPDVTKVFAENFDEISKIREMYADQADYNF